MADTLIEGYELELSAPECRPDVPVWAASARLGRDVSAVMPYLNAVLDRAVYDADNHYVIWKEEGRRYALRPHELSVSAIIDREQASELVEEAVAAINGIWSRREEIVPDYHRRTPPKVLDILRHLPRTNCRACSMASCMAFAAELAGGNLMLEDCPPLCDEENADARSHLEELGL